MLTLRVRRELQRRGNADVMLFVKSIASPGRKHGRRQAMEIEPSDLGPLFIDDERNFVSRLAKEKKLRAPIEHSSLPSTNSPEHVSNEHGYFSHFHYFPRLGIALGTVTDETLRSAAKIPVARLVAPLDVSPIRPIRRRQIARPSAQVSWGIQRLKIDRLWNQGVTGSNVLIGHVDTGVDSTHSTLTGAVRDFAFIDDSGQVDPFQIIPFDADDHGTHTAGTIAGRPAGGFHVGVAPGALLLSAGVIESGTVSSRLISGLAWVVDHGAQIVNVSLGVRGYDEDFLPLTRRLREIGVLPVFAVGNEGPNTSRSPGNYDEAVSVGAIDNTPALAAFSSYEQIEHARTVPDLVAPGDDIESAMPGGGYQSMSGTSMAAPHISGLAALLLQAAPGSSEDQIESAIFRSCVPPSAGPLDSFGRGYPDAVEALRLIRM